MYKCIIYKAQNNAQKIARRVEECTCSDTDWSV